GGIEALHLVALWPGLTAAGAALLVAAGAYTLIRGASWPGMGSRYDRHSAPGAARSSDPAELWKSLDSGADPTLDPRPEAAGGGRPVPRTHLENQKEP
ncbi:Trp biosynthesis-associated membrane protein, partial [Streptomonospora algeriensis]